MQNTVKPTRVRDLIRLLDTMRLQQQQLLDCLESKLDAVRRADVQALQVLHRKEAALVAELRERDGFRRQLMDRIGCELGLPVGAGRALHVSRLASHVTSEHAGEACSERTQLLAAAKELRDVVFAVQRANRVVGAVSRELVTHLGSVFASVVPKDNSLAGYSGNGAVVSRSELRVFEAVG